MKSSARASSSPPKGKSGSSRSGSPRRTRNPKNPPAIRTRRSTEGRALLVAGSAGSGKTSWTLQQCELARRLLVWDSAGEWSRRRDVRAVPTLKGLHFLVTAELRGELELTRWAYVGPVTREHFETFCRLAWVWIRSKPGSHLVIEELADVTSPGKAPAAWGEIARKHRHHGCTVFALTQRPAESDKTILGNATVLHVGRMNFASDRLYMARCLDVPQEQIDALADLDFLERNMRTRLLTAGRVTF